MTRHILLHYMQVVPTTEQIMNVAPKRMQYLYHLHQKGGENFTDSKDFLENVKLREWGECCVCACLGWLV